MTTQRSIINYHGSKYRMLVKDGTNFLKYFPLLKPNHGVFAEPFVGGFNVGLNVLANSYNLECQANDINADLINLWVCVARHRAELEDRVHDLYAGVEKFIDWNLDDAIDRAAKFWMDHLKTAFIDRAPIFEKDLSRVHAILEKHRVRFWNKDGAEFIRIMSSIYKNRGRYKLVIYADPPYLGLEGYAGDRDFDHGALASALHAVPEHQDVFVSYNDCPEVRELYPDFYIMSLGERPVIGKHDGLSKPRVELFMSNHDIRDHAIEQRCGRLF